TLGHFWVPRLRGTAALQVRNDHWSLDQDLEGVRPLGAVLGDRSFVWSQQGMRPTLGHYWVRGCEGPQPSRSGTTIGALIRTWRAPGPSAPCWAIEALFGRNKAYVQRRVFYWVPRLRGTAALQVRNDHWSLDQDLEGVRSLGAGVLGDRSFVWSQQ